VIDPNVSPGTRGTEPATETGDGRSMLAGTVARASSACQLARSDAALDTTPSETRRLVTHAGGWI